MISNHGSSLSIQGGERFSFLFLSVFRIRCSLLVRLPVGRSCVVLVVTNTVSLSLAFSLVSSKRKSSAPNSKLPIVPCTLQPLTNHRGHAGLHTGHCPAPISRSVSFFIDQRGHDAMATRDKFPEKPNLNKEGRGAGTKPT